MVAPKILIVDDSETARRALRTMLRSRSWTICGEAESGAAGVKKFQELRPDIVILDLAMPDIDGLETAKRMSAMNPNVPLLLFTIVEIEGLEETARGAGIRAVVTKNNAWSLIPNIEKLLFFLN